jgi:hypothetical protein
MRTWKAMVWLVGLGLLGSACGVDVIEVEIKEQGQVGMAAISFPGMEQFGTSLGRSLSDKDVNPDDVDSLKLIRLQLFHRSVGVQPADLTFLHDLRFDATATGLAAATLAEQAEFAAGTREADLPPADVELKPYLEAGSMRLELDATVNPPPAALIDLEVVLRFRVDVNVI